MHITTEHADHIASHYTETAALIAQEYRGRRADYLAEIERETQEIASLPVSQKAKDALISHNAIIHRQVLNII